MPISLSSSRPGRKLVSRQMRTARLERPLQSHVVAHGRYWGRLEICCEVKVAFEVANIEHAFLDSRALTMTKR